MNKYYINIFYFCKKIKSEMYITQDNQSDILIFIEIFKS